MQQRIVLSRRAAIVLVQLCCDTFSHYLFGKALFASVTSDDRTAQPQPSPRRLRLREASAKYFSFQFDCLLCMRPLVGAGTAATHRRPALNTALLRVSSSSLCLGTSQGQLRIYDTRTARMAPDLEWVAHEDAILDLHSAGNVLLSAGDWTVRQWDLRLLRPVWEYEGHEEAVVATTLDRVNGLVITGSLDRCDFGAVSVSLLLDVIVAVDWDWFSG